MAGHGLLSEWLVWVVQHSARDLTWPGLWSTWCLTPLWRTGRQVPTQGQGQGVSLPLGRTPLQRAHTQGHFQASLPPARRVLHLEFGHALAVGCGVQAGTVCA